MIRLHNLDYLRGLAAFGIMIYHFLSWTFGDYTANTFLGRLGIYGVSIFYVLSGLTLYHVYSEKFKFSTEDIMSFCNKRIFRIFPLLWLVTLLSIIFTGIRPNFNALFLNLSGLFGFIRWDVYFSAGVWSIGNELVFYAFFPIFMLFIKKIKPLMIVLILMLFAFYLYFAFIKLNSNISFNEQWKDYINPLNQVFLFLGGFLISYIFQNKQINNSLIIFLLVLSSTIFVFYPVTGNVINLVTGTNRLVFTICSFIICFCFYKLTFQFAKFIHQPLTILGEASYSVYLLHPIVWIFTGSNSSFFSVYIYNFPPLVSIAISVILTLIIGYFVYQYFEKYFIKLGRKEYISTIYFGIKSKLNSNKIDNNS